MVTSTFGFILDHEKYAHRSFLSQRAAVHVPALFFPAMVHADAVLGVAGVAGMILQAGLLNLAAQFAAVRLLSLRCSVAAV
jgi:hypothetical protein